jgi:hypothetical protein
MAVRNDFTAGEVLAAADLNDTFGSRVPFAYGTATPTTTVSGFLWYDTNFTPPVGKVWNGSAFVNFSQGPADFSDAATGTYTDGGVNYKYITYTGSGTVTITRAGLCDVLVVGGGGGGGFYGGGGGAGGHGYDSAYLAATSHTITVGAGGLGVSSPGNHFPAGLNGNSSGIGTLIVAPGGGGGGGVDKPGSNGGSGGGGGCQSAQAGGAGYPAQGNSGGTGSGSSSAFGGGGGGGAGAVGGNGSGTNGGNGGAGSANSITGSSVTRAGGGGGGVNSGTGGTGGTGGGGAGSNSSGVAGVSGTGNTGGGGGGGFNNSVGGNGGSGVVIIRVRTN